MPSSLWAPFLCLGQSNSRSRPISCVDSLLLENDGKFCIFSKSWIISAENRAHWSASRDASFSPANRRALFLLSSFYEKRWNSSFLEISTGSSWIISEFNPPTRFVLETCRCEVWGLRQSKLLWRIRAQERRGGNFFLELGTPPQAIYFFVLFASAIRTRELCVYFLISGEDELYATLVAILKVRCVSCQESLRWMEIVEEDCLESCWRNDHFV